MGVGLGSNDNLYDSESLNNRIAAIPHALTRNTTAHAGNDVTANGAINDPLGLTIAPNGNILVANGNNGRIVATTPSGTPVAKKLVDNTWTPPGASSLVGPAVVPHG